MAKDSTSAGAPAPPAPRKSAFRFLRRASSASSLSASRPAPVISAPVAAPRKPVAAPLQASKTMSLKPTLSVSSGPTALLTSKPKLSHADTARSQSAIISALTCDANNNSSLFKTASSSSENKLSLETAQKLNLLTPSQAPMYLLSTGSDIPIGLQQKKKMKQQQQSGQVPAVSAPAPPPSRARESLKNAAMPLACNPPAPKLLRDQHGRFFYYFSDKAAEEEAHIPAKPHQPNLNRQPPRLLPDAFAVPAAAAAAAAAAAPCAMQKSASAATVTGAASVSLAARTSTASSAVSAVSAVSSQTVSVSRGDASKRTSLTVTYTEEYNAGGGESSSSDEKQHQAMAEYLLAMKPPHELMQPRNAADQVDAATRAHTAIFTSRNPRPAKTDTHRAQHQQAAQRGRWKADCAWPEAEAPTLLSSSQHRSMGSASSLSSTNTSCSSLASSSSSSPPTSLSSVASSTSYPHDLPRLHGPRPKLYTLSEVGSNNNNNKPPMADVFQHHSLRGSLSPRQSHHSSSSARFAQAQVVTAGTSGRFQRRSDYSAHYSSQFRASVASSGSHASTSSSVRRAKTLRYSALNKDLPPLPPVPAAESTSLPRSQSTGKVYGNGPTSTDYYYNTLPAEQLAHLYQLRQPQLASRRHLSESSIEEESEYGDDPALMDEYFQDEPLIFRQSQDSSLSLRSRPLLLHEQSMRSLSSQLDDDTKSNICYADINSHRTLQRPLQRQDSLLPRDSHLRSGSIDSSYSSVSSASSFSRYKYPGAPSSPPPPLPALHPGFLQSYSLSVPPPSDVYPQYYSDHSRLPPPRSPSFSSLQNRNFSQTSVASSIASAQSSIASSSPGRTAPPKLTGAYHYPSASSDYRPTRRAPAPPGSSTADDSSSTSTATVAPPPPRADSPLYADTSSNPFLSPQSRKSSFRTRHRPQISNPFSISSAKQVFDLEDDETEEAADTVQRLTPVTNIVNQKKSSIYYQQQQLLPQTYTNVYTNEAFTHSAPDQSTQESDDNMLFDSLIPKSLRGAKSHSAFESKSTSKNARSKLFKPAFREDEYDGADEDAGPTHMPMPMPLPSDRIEELASPPANTRPPLPRRASSPPLLETPSAPTPSKQGSTTRPFRFSQNFSLRRRSSGTDPFAAGQAPPAHRSDVLAMFNGLLHGNTPDAAATSAPAAAPTVAPPAKASSPDTLSATATPPELTSESDSDSSSACSDKWERGVAPYPGETLESDKTRSSSSSASPSMNRAGQATTKHQSSPSKTVRFSNPRLDAESTAVAPAAPATPVLPQHGKSLSASSSSTYASCAEGHSVSPSNRTRDRSNSSPTTPRAAPAAASPSPPSSAVARRRRKADTSTWAGDLSPTSQPMKNSRQPTAGFVPVIPPRSANRALHENRIRSVVNAPRYSMASNNPHSTDYLDQIEQFCTRIEEPPVAVAVAPTSVPPLQIVKKHKSCTALSTEAPAAAMSAAPPLPYAVHARESSSSSSSSSQSASSSETSFAEAACGLVVPPQELQRLQELHGRLVQQRAAMRAAQNGNPGGGSDSDEAGRAVPEREPGQRANDELAPALWCDEGSSSSSSAGASASSTQGGSLQTPTPRLACPPLPFVLDSSSSSSSNTSLRRLSFLLPSMSYMSSTDSLVTANAAAVPNATPSRLSSQSMDDVLKSFISEDLSMLDSLGPDSFSLDTAAFVHQQMNFHHHHQLPFQPASRHDSVASAKSRLRQSSVSAASASSSSPAPPSTPSSPWDPPARTPSTSTSTAAAATIERRPSTPRSIVNSIKKSRENLFKSNRHESLALSDASRYSGTTAASSGSEDNDLTLIAVTHIAPGEHTAATAAAAAAAAAASKKLATMPATPATPSSRYYDEEEDEENDDEGSDVHLRTQVFRLSGTTTASSSPAATVRRATPPQTALGTAGFEIRHVDSAGMDDEDEDDEQDDKSHYEHDTSRDSIPSQPERISVVPVTVPAQPTHKAPPPPLVYKPSPTVTIITNGTATAAPAEPPKVIKKRMSVASKLRLFGRKKSVAALR